MELKDFFTNILKLNQFTTNNNKMLILTSIKITLFSELSISWKYRMDKIDLMLQF